jgi:protein SCO1/2
MYRIVFLLTASVSLFSCSSKQKISLLPYYNTPDFTPLFFNETQASTAIDHHITDFAFTDQDNKTITQKNIEGRIHVANFFFTGCGSICPAMMGNLQKTYDIFKSDTAVVFLSYSVTPWRDSVARLKKYAADFSIKAPWHLLTGNKGAIYQLARQSYFAEESLGYSKDSTAFLHTEHILLIDKQKRIRGIYNGTLPLETEQLAKDIAVLKGE